MHFLRLSKNGCILYTGFLSSWGTGSFRRSPLSIGNWGIERKFFFELGGLDVGMKLWGGDNIDISVRSAMAGGRHVNVPCAHAAHYAVPGSRDYRAKFSPAYNNMRVVESLFDPEYKETIFYFNPKWKV